MKIRKFLAAICLMSTSAHSAIVLTTSHPNLDGTTTPDTFIVDTLDARLVTGFAGVGGFATLTDLEVTTLVGLRDFDALADDFVPFVGTDNFSAGMIFQNGNASPGAFAVQNDVLDPTSFIGQSLYTFVGDGSSLALSNAYLLFRHTETLSADPLPPAGPNQYSLDFGSGALLVGTSTTIFTTDAPLGINSSTEVNAIQLEVVPEPSALLLSSVGILALLRRKRA